jgi:hypothetical protein
MKESHLKYFFRISSASLFILMLLISRDAGISCDEVLHYNHSVAVYNFFATHGEDKEAVNTPVTQLKYYGQSYDNLVTILTKWFDIENVYGFRNIMSSVAGWLAILVTALFAVWLAGYRAGIIVIILFAVSPTFIGHSQNNLKDIPFALGYISSTYYIVKFLVAGRKISILDTVLLTVSIGFSISIRAGGLVLICYLFFFFFLFQLCKYFANSKTESGKIWIILLWITGISIVSWFLAVILWPYALQSPVRNVLESYRIMAHFPCTFRQIFQGKVEWSDFMPWYYLPESMLITIPVIVLAGVVLFFVFSKYTLKTNKVLQYVIIIFTIIFPMLFVVYEKSNLYSSWRQFLFLYPAIVLLAATGFHFLLEYLDKRKYFKWGVVILFVLLTFHPLRFMIANPAYSYMYYNQLVGGLHGAYGNFETDYYYVSQTEASKWLINYLKEKKNTGPLKVKATYSVQWLFRNHPEIETSYFRYEERSMTDWDYSIVVNRYISPYQLKNKIWPPQNTIHVIYADRIPVCAVLERRSKDDFNGINALNEGRIGDALKYFEKALQVDNRDEMIFYNYSAALYADKQYQKADSVLKMGLEINPDSEPILMYLGNIARSQNKTDEAIIYYNKVLEVNRKYFEAYIAIAELLTDRDLMKARALLRTCLVMSPRYKPAIVALANTYRSSDPDIAKKYDDLLKTIK